MIKVIKPNQPVDIRLKLAATNRAILKTKAPRLIGDIAVKQEINIVMISLLIISKIIGRPYNKRGSSSDFKGLCARYTIL
jgi:hypothetical protein